MSMRTRVAFGLMIVSTLVFGGVQLSAAANPNCPAPDPDVFCILVYDPVVCGGCRYSNDCFAAAAGWDVETQCREIGRPDQTQPI